MKNERTYRVKVLQQFTDYLGKEIIECNRHLERVPNEVFECSESRAEHLMNLGLVFVVEIPKMGTFA